MSGWTNKYAIMRDLAEAQGFDVPADLEGIGANEKPPAPNIPEETGEDYFGHCDGDGDCAGPPDLALIQHMLDVVRDVGISKPEVNPEEVVHISKPSNLNIGIDITKTRTGTIPKTVQTNVKPQAKKVRRKRENVAVNSILQAMAADTPILNMELPKEPLKLLKPTDFISESTDTEIVQSVEKVNGWLDRQVTSTSVPRFSGNPLMLEPTSMFRKKTIKSPTVSNKSSPQKKDTSTTASYKPSLLPEDIHDSSSNKSKASSFEPSSMFKRRSGSTVKSPESDSVESSPPQQGGISTIGTFRPSGLAGEYYKKYMERSKVKEQIKEDVWTRAERIMKEIDTKKKNDAKAAEEAALLESIKDVAIIDTALEAATRDDESLIKSIDESVVGTSDPKVPDTLRFLQTEQKRPSRDSLCRDIIELPQHRHLLTEDCIVCKVVTAHGYDVDSEIYGNAK